MKVLIVDDHAMFRAVVRTVLTDRIGLRDVWGVANCAEARAAFQQANFDLVVCDIELEDGDGLEVAGEFAESDPTLRIVMVSSHTDEVTLTRVFESAVIGFVDKASEDLDGLERAMRAAFNWEIYFSASVQDHPLRVALSRLHYSKILSDREVGLMHCFGLGMSNEAIAEEADLAVGTIQTHRRNIMKKLELRNMGELMRYCFIKGFTRLSDLRQNHWMTDQEVIH